MPWGKRAKDNILPGFHQHCIATRSDEVEGWKRKERNGEESCTEDLATQPNFNKLLVRNMRAQLNIGPGVTGFGRERVMLFC